MFPRIISRSINYIRAFGIISGIRLLFQLEFHGGSEKSDQVRSYRVPGFSNPIRMRNTSGDRATFWQCIVSNQYDLEKFPSHIKRFKENIANDEDPDNRHVIVDGGANIGLSTIWFLENFPEAKCVAIEPDQGNYELLLENTKAYGDRVLALRGALWPTHTSIEITNPEAGSCSFQISECASQSAIRAYTVGDVMGLAETSTISILKLDIEGSQNQLFQANTDFVENCKLIILELEDWKFPWQSSSESFFRRTSQSKFDYLIAGENIFCFKH